MKKYIFLVFALLAARAAFSQGYQVTLQAPGYKSGIAYLTYYMGNNFNIQDSAAVTGTGTAIFKGAEKLQPGIYAVFLPGKSLRVEFLVDQEQKINIKTDTTDIINKTIITGSKENVLYQQYQKFIAQKGSVYDKEQQAYKQSKNKADSALHQQNLTKVSKEMTDYRLQLIKDHPTAMMAVLFNAMKEPVLPEKSPKTRQDSINNYNYYKAHYWDGISFMDDRIIRTPFFLPKLERYYRDIVIVADTIIKEADYELLLARNAPEMYKFLLNWLTDEFINPKYMGQDAVFVHLFQTYHSQGKSSWLNSGQMEKVSRRAYMLMSNLIGEKAADLTLTDTAGKTSSLYNLQADYTIVCFWDPHCGHCKEEVPRLDSMYNARWKNRNVKIYAVLTPDDKETESVKKDWNKFIVDNGLGDWTNVYQTQAAEDEDRVAQRPGFRQLYDVTMTPTFFLLDKEKRIIAKKLSIKQLDDLLEYKWNNKNQN
jgi:thiol-disulfide isomerase/thioredoxin